MDYEALAPAYDRFTRGVDYDDLCSYLTDLLKRHGIDSGLILDLACGTGELALRMSVAGYDVIGVDASEDMLALAAAKDYSNAVTPPVFVCQDIRELDLYGTVNACVCTLDAVNHITDPLDLAAVFDRLFLFIEPNGVFIFDINTPAKFAKIEGETFVDEDDDFFCVWSVFASEDDGCYDYVIDLFSREGDVWRRGGEEITERAYTISELSEMLRQAGFETLSVCGERTFEAPKDDEQRVFVIAKRMENA